jgi:hypothetical protein
MNIICAMDRHHANINNDLEELENKIIELEDEILNPNKIPFKVELITILNTHIVFRITLPDEIDYEKINKIEESLGGFISRFKHIELSYGSSQKP